MDGLIDGWLDRRTDGGEIYDGFMDGWMNGYVDEWMDE